MTARDDAMAASYHADTADAEYRKLWDVADRLAAALRRVGRDGVVVISDETTHHFLTCDGYDCRTQPMPASDAHVCEQARAALEAWAPYRPVWEVTG